MQWPRSSKQFKPHGILIVSVSDDGEFRIEYVYVSGPEIKFIDFTIGYAVAALVLIGRQQYVAPWARAFLIAIQTVSLWSLSSASAVKLFSFRRLPWRQPPRNTTQSEAEGVVESPALLSLSEGNIE